MRFVFGTLIAFLILSVTPSAAEECRRVYVTKVTDGDTFTGFVKVYSSIHELNSIRVKGIDTPEKNWRAKCDKERVDGIKATNWAKETIPLGWSKLCISGIKKGKYAGRRLADVYLKGKGKKSYADLAIKNGYAREYHGGKKSNWCIVD